MTSATTHSHSPTLAEDKGARESVIRDLYALVAFVVANPDFPLPDRISVHCTAPLEVVKAIAAERAGGEVYGARPMTDFNLDGTARRVNVLVVSPREDTPL